MNSEFLQLLSDESAAPNPAFKAELKAALAQRVPAPASAKTTQLSLSSLSQAQMLIGAAIAAAVIASVALFLLRLNNSTVVTITGAEQPSSNPTVEIGAGRVIGVNDNSNDIQQTPVGSNASTPEPSQPTTASATSGDSDELVDELSQDDGMDVPPVELPPQITVCRNEIATTIREDDRLSTDNDLPCASTAFAVSFFNVESDDRLFAQPVAEPVLATTADAIQFQWGLGAPDVLVNSDMFIMHASRTMRFNEGALSLSGRADDAIRVYIDDALVINHWNSSGSHAFKYNGLVKAGLHEVRLEYVDVSGDAFVQMYIQN